MNARNIFVFVLIKNKFDILLVLTIFTTHSSFLTEFPRKLIKNLIKNLNFSLLILQRISERALDGLNNLKTLNLRNNLLKKIDNGLLRGTPALLSINVQANKLETLTFYTFQPIMDNLVNSTSELLLSGELPNCSCCSRSAMFSVYFDSSLRCVGEGKGRVGEVGRKS